MPSLCNFPIAIGLPSLVAPLAPWTKATAYGVGDRVVSDGAPGTRIYTCVVAGTSAAAAPGPAGTGAGIADNTCTWDYTGPFVVPGIPAIPSLTLLLPPCYLDEF